MKEISLLAVLQKVWTLDTHTHTHTHTPLFFFSVLSQGGIFAHRTDLSWLGNDKNDFEMPLLIYLSATSLSFVLS